MKKAEARIKGVYFIEPFYAKDDRGDFLKDFSVSQFKEMGISHNLEETFYINTVRNAIRAIHFQGIEQQAKLIRCHKGRLFTVIVDLRKGSESFGDYTSFWLTGEDKFSVLVPEGCGLGYLAIEDSLVSYKVSKGFNPKYDSGVRWDDEDLGIAWPLHLVDELIISEKDKNLPSFLEYKEGAYLYEI